MSETALVSNLVNAGVGGLVILVVVLFLKFLGQERDKSAKEHQDMMVFIADQRKANNEALLNATRENSDAYVQVVDAVKGLTIEIRGLKEAQLVHDTAMTVALDDMRKARANKPGG